MFRLFVRSILLTVVLTALLFLVRGIGAQVKNPLVDMFTETTFPDGQRQVCWHDICPGKTTVEQAKAILNADTFLYVDKSAPVGRLCWVDTSPQEIKYVCLEVADDHIEQLHLYLSYSYWAEPRIRLGDVVILWRQPLKSSVGPRCAYLYTLFGNNVLIYTTDLSNRYYDDVNVNTFRLEPRSQIDDFVIFASALKIDVPHSTNWRGFAWFQGWPGVCGIGE